MDKKRVSVSSASEADSPVSSRTRMRANRSGYSASTFPGTFIAMEALKKSEIFCSTRLSKVELHALATLAVPKGEEENRVQSRMWRLKTELASVCFSYSAPGNCIHQLHFVAL